MWTVGTTVTRWRILRMVNAVYKQPPVRLLLQIAAALLAGGALYASVIGSLSEPPTRSQLFWSLSAAAVTSTLAFIAERRTAREKKQSLPVIMKDQAWRGGKVSNLAPRRIIFGRTRHLNTLRRRLRPDAQSRVQAVVGMPGVGKSTLAMEVAWSMFESCHVLWVIRAESTATVEADLTSLGIALGLFDVNVDPAVARIALARYFSQGNNWILIFDNATSHTPLSPYLPQSTTGNILLTSREHAWGSFATTLTLGPLTSAASQSLLRRRTRGEADTYIRLADQMDGLPLALEQARSYMERSGCSAEEYEKLLTTSMPQSRVLRESTSVDKTMLTSVAQVKRESKTAITLLHAVALLAPENIPLEYVRTSLSQRHQKGFDKALAVLYGYSILSRTDSGYFIHRVPRSFLQNNMSGRLKRRLTRRLLPRLLTVASSPRDVSTWAEANAVCPHVVCLASFLPDASAGSRVLAASLHAFIDTQLVQRNATMAHVIATEAVRIAWRPEGNNTTGASLLMSDLGDASRALGYMSQAMDCHKRSLSVRILRLGKRAPLVANAYELLANDFYEAGDYIEAVRLHRLSVSIRRDTTQEDNRRHLGAALGGLANALREVGNHEEAKDLYEKALWRVSAAGDLLSFLSLMNGLGHALTGLSRFRSATAAHTYVLRKLRSLDGETAFREAEALAGLADSQAGLGRTVLAYSLRAQVTETYATLLGTEHSRTKAAAAKLAP